MDFLNQVVAQVTELFRSLTPGARVAAGLLLAVIVVSLVFLFRFEGSAGDEFLFAGRAFSTRELAGMEGAFAKAKLGRYELVGNRIKVPRGQKNQYISALADSKAMPKEFDSFTEEQNNASTMLFPSKVIEERMKQAKQQNLALIISRMSGIDECTVQVDEAQKGGLNRQKEFVAAVAVWAKNAAPLDEDQIRAIRDNIAGSVAGLKRENITITDMNAGRSYAGTGEDGMPVATDDPYFARKRVYERDWRDKILSRLSYVPGVTAEVNVELDPELLHQQDQFKFDPKVVALKTSETTETSSSTTPGNAGRPGTGSNVNTSATLATTAGGNSQVEKTTSDQQNIPGHELTKMRKAALIPNRVTASIGVPAGYYLKVWQERNPAAENTTPKPPDPAELKKIESDIKKKIEGEVVALFPARPAGTDVYPQVHVSTDDSLTMPPPAAPSTALAAGVWFAENWQTVALVGVGLVSLYMLRGFVKGAPATPPAKLAAAADGTEAAPQLKVVGGEADENGEGDARVEASKRRFATGGPNIRDELAGLIREDPEAAASILRNWIGEAS